MQKQKLSLTLHFFQVLCLLGMAACSALVTPPPSPILDSEESWPRSVCDVPPRFATAVQTLRDSRLRLFWASAHRGDRDAAPDNSLKAIGAAAEAGIPLIEIDVRFTKEGKPFLFHDRTLRAENIIAPDKLYGRKSSELSDQELMTLRLPADHSTPLATLRAALTTIRPYRSALQLDLKSESYTDINRVVSLLRSMEMTDRVVMQCDTLETLKYIRSRFPTIATLARAYRHREVTQMLPLRPDIVQIDAELATDEILGLITASGSRPLVKTLKPLADNVTIWKSLYERGVQILLSDHPAELQRFVIAVFCSS